MLISENMAVEAVDGHCGKVADVVLDPVRLRVTHLVIDPPGAFSPPHLVPVSAVDRDAGPLTLTWTRRQLLDADLVHEADFIELGSWPRLQDGWEIGVVRALAWPYYPSTHVSERDEDWPGHAGWREGAERGGGTESAVEYDRIPSGTAEIRRASQVISSDGHVVGHVDGFVADADYAITHLVLERGHLWGHREITIPVSDVRLVKTDAVRLALTRDEVGRLPSVPFHRHPGAR